jgi:hypothetical protein
MKNWIQLFLLLITSCLSLFGQNNDSWTSFRDNDTSLIGYKDKNGVIKIEPRFTDVTRAEKFDKIIAVAEETDDKYSIYYLTKTGKTVGRDSMYIFDNSFDCESEGFIRFRDHTTDKAGMFDGSGNIAIPAEYNDLTSVMNGMIIALKGAQKEYWDNIREHYSWVGGKEMVIDTLNHVLIDDFPYTTNLDFFSIKKTETPHLETIRDYFPAKDGGYYSFINFEKEFRQWLIDSLFVNLTTEKLINVSFDTITWNLNNSWEKSNREHFVTNNFEKLKYELLEFLNPDCEYSISSNGFNVYTYESIKFEKYYNNCGESKKWIYPLMEIAIFHKQEKHFPKNHFEFLRTENGFKLISVTISGNDSQQQASKPKIEYYLFINKSTVIQLDSLNLNVITHPKWIKKIVNVKDEKNKYIHGNTGEELHIYPKKRYKKRILENYKRHLDVVVFQVYE